MQLYKKVRINLVVKYKKRMFAPTMRIVSQLKPIKMKKVLLVLSVVVLSSCNNDNEYIYNVECPKTDVRLSIKSKEAKSNKQSKSVNSDVNRGDIPVAVKQINVTSESVSTGIDREATYNLVDDGSGANGFIISDVPLGENNFTATTTAVASNLWRVNQFATNSFTAQEKLDDNKANTPYAVYNGNVGGANITGENDFITMPMTTENGRLNTVVILEESLRKDYYLQVASIVSNGSPVKVITASNGKKGISLYWSSEDSVAGENQGITINVFHKDGTFINGETVILTVQASTGLNTIYTVYRDHIYAETAGFNFTFQEWNELDAGN